MESNSQPDPAPIETPSLPELSEREHEVLRLVASGTSNKHIAEQLVISPNTVKVHLRNIFAKLGVATRTEAALFAIRTGLVQVRGEAPIVAVEEAMPALEEAAKPGVPETMPRAGQLRQSNLARWSLLLAVAVAVVVVGGSLAVYFRTRPSPPPSPRLVVTAALPGLNKPTFRPRARAWPWQPMKTRSMPSGVKR